MLLIILFTKLFANITTISPKNMKFNTYLIFLEIASMSAGIVGCRVTVLYSKLQMIDRDKSRFEHKFIDPMWSFRQYHIIKATR